jgi:hypothetical protein
MKCLLLALCVCFMSCQSISITVFKPTPSFTPSSDNRLVTKEDGITTDMLKRAEYYKIFSNMLVSKQEVDKKKVDYFVSETTKNYILVGVGAIGLGFFLGHVIK